MNISSEHANCLNFVFKFRSFMYTNLMNNSDKFRFVGATAKQSNMYETQHRRNNWLPLLNTLKQDYYRRRGKSDLSTYKFDMIVCLYLINEKWARERPISFAKRNFVRSRINVHYQFISFVFSLNDRSERSFIHQNRLFNKIVRTVKNDRFLEKFINYQSIHFSTQIID